MDRLYNRTEVQAAVACERAGQPFMDSYYAGRGWSVDRREASRQFDVKLARDGKVMTVEEKYSRSMRYTDLLIEVMQAVETGQLGWLYDCQADFLHYIVVDDQCTPYYLYRLPWPRFRRWFMEWLAAIYWPHYITSTRGIGISVSVAVEVGDIPRYLYELFDLQK